MSRSRARTAGAVLASMTGVAVVSYAAVVAAAWLRYGHAATATPDERDAFLDRFMPEYEVVERHHIVVAAPADVTFGALMDMDLEDSSIIRAIFKGRELLLGADAEAKPRARGLVAMTRELGWGTLADAAGHEIVMGAVTQPWNANVVFRGVPREEFADFNEPGYVKIAWTLRVDAAGEGASIARTETRAIATDAEARRKFRWYWARFSPGIVLIRAVSLPLVKKEAERRAQTVGQS